MEQQEESYRQLGGWLRLFYILNLCAPLVLLIAHINPYMVNTRLQIVQHLPLSMLAVIRDAIIAVLAVIVAYLVKKHDRRCIAVFNVSRCIVIGFSVINDLVLTQRVFVFISVILTQGILLIGMNACFRRSRRAQCYFGRKGEIDA